MAIQGKYQPALDLVQELGGNYSVVKEENGVLTVTGTVETPYDKNQIWDKIKDLGGDSPTDLVADIQTSTTAYFAKYKVVEGDTLGKIAKLFFKDPLKYTDIFKANTDVLDHPDKIEVGQVLTIPNP